MKLSIPLAGLLAVSLAAGARTADALTHEVGPGKTYANVGDVPWESLNAGDTVLIYHRATPYKEKFVLSRVGTPSAPITVRGVLGPLGERPVLDGNGATTRSQLDYYSRNRGVIKIGGSTATASSTTPATATPAATSSTTSTPRRWGSRSSTTTSAPCGRAPPATT